MPSMRYSVIGLGKLGASMVAAIASRGLEVVGVDVSQRAVDLVNAGRAPVAEPGLEDTLQANRARLRATLSTADAVQNSDVTFVVVPTPSADNGGFSLRHAAAAFAEIGRALAGKPAYHTVVLTSTVLPGATRFGLLPVLETEAGKAVGRDFGLCYSPEFIALGSVLHDFLNPDFTLVGELDQRSGDVLAAAYAEIMANQAPCQRMSIENAELAKIALNAYVTTKITFANMLAQLCQRIPGGNVDVVTAALGLDRRIGRNYLTGGLGYGGPCFPRDNAALNYLAGALGARAELSETTDSVNRSLPGRYADQIMALAQPGDTVAVLGLAYKPFSHVTEESQGLWLARLLAERGLQVIAFEPQAAALGPAEVPGEIELAATLAACLQQADVVVVTTPDPVFRALTADDFPARRRPVVVVDFWRVLAARLAGCAHLRYVPIGWSVEDEANAARLLALWGEG